MYKYGFIFFWAWIISMPGFATSATEDNRWIINPSGGITWIVDNRLPHHDRQAMQPEVSETLITTSTDPSKGVDGEYEIRYHVGGQTGHTLQPGDSITTRVTSRR